MPGRAGAFCTPAYLIRFSTVAQSCRFPQKAIHPVRASGGGGGDWTKPSVSHSSKWCADFLAAGLSGQRKAPLRRSARCSSGAFQFPPLKLGRLVSFSKSRLPVTAGTRRPLCRWVVPSGHERGSGPVAWRRGAQLITGHTHVGGAPAAERGMTGHMWHRATSPQRAA